MIFKSTLNVKEVPEYYQLVLHILCMTIYDVINYCFSRFMGKLHVYDQVVINT